VVAAGQPLPAAPVAAHQPGSAQQPSHSLAADVHAVVQPQLSMDARRAVGGAAALMDLADPLSELPVGDHPSTRWPALPGIKARARHTQHAAQLGDSVVCLLLLDQPKRHRR
jgi:hypothetical protein